MSAVPPFGQLGIRGHRRIGFLRHRIQQLQASKAQYETHRVTAEGQRRIESTSRLANQRQPGMHTVRSVSGFAQETARQQDSNKKTGNIARFCQRG